MTQSEMYSIELGGNEIVVRLNAALVDQATLTAWLDYLELESIRKRSQLTEEEAAAVSAEIDQSTWTAMKENFLR